MSNLTLSLTANISDAQTKLAVLRSALTDVNATVRQQSAAYVEADNAARATMLPALQAVTAEQKNLQAGVNAATIAVKGHGEAHQGLFAKLQQNRAALQEVEHSIRASMDALAAGASPMKVASQELPRIIQAFTELNGVSLSTVLAMAGVAAGVIAVGGGLAALVIHAENVDEMFGKMQAAFEATGRGTEFTRAGAIVLIDALRSLHGVSTQNAEDMVQGFARIRTIGIGSFLDLGTAVAGYARVSGGDVKSAQETLTRALEGGYESVRKLDEQWQIFTPGQAEIARKFSDTGDKAGFMGVAISALKDKFGALIDTGLTPTQKASNDLGVAWNNLMHTFGQNSAINGARDAIARLLETMAGGINTDALETAKAKLTELQQIKTNSNPNNPLDAVFLPGIDRDIAKLQDFIALQEKAKAAAIPTGEAVPDAQQELTKQALDDYHKQTAAKAEQEKIENKIAEYQKAQQGTTGETFDALQHGIDALRVKMQSLKDAGGQTIVQQLQVELDQRIAKEQVFGAQAKALELKFWTDKLALIKTAADQANGEIEAGSRAAYQIQQKAFTLSQAVHSEEVAATKKEIAEKKQATEQWWRDYSTGMEQAIKQSAGNYDQMKALAKDWEDTGKILFGDHIAHFKSASDAILKIDAEEKAQLRKNAEKEAAFEAEQARHAQAMSQIQAKPDAGEFKVNAFDLVFSDGATKLQEQIQAQSDALTTGLRAELADLQSEMEAATTAGDSNRYQAALDKQVEAQARTTQQITALQARAATATEAAWEKALSPIDRAFSSSVQGILEGTQTTAQAMNKLAESIVMSFINAAEQDLVHWIAHELAKTTATTTGTATRKGVVAAGATSETVAENASGVAYAGVETAKTAAAVEGSTIRSTAATGEAAAGKAESAAAGSTSIMNDAYKAAAATYANVAEIPYVGWILAPVAAAGAFAAVAAYDVLSAEGGAWEINGTTPAVLHHQESVLPAAVAAPMRDFFSNGAAGALQLSVPQIRDGMNFSAPPAAANAATSQSAGGDTYHVTVQAIDTQAGAQFIQQHARTIVTALRAQVRNGTPLPGVR
jgi:hypothetical protein